MYGWRGQSGADGIRVGDFVGSAPCSGMYRFGQAVLSSRHEFEWPFAVRAEVRIAARVNALRLLCEVTDCEEGFDVFFVVYLSVWVQWRSQSKFALGGEVVF